MIFDLMNGARTAALSDVIEKYYEQAYDRYGWNLFIATANLVSSFTNHLDYVAEARPDESDVRLFVLNDLFLGRDKRWMTVWIDSNESISAQANFKLSNKEFTKLLNDLVNVVTQTLMPKV